MIHNYFWSQAGQQKQDVNTKHANQHASNMANSFIRCYSNMEMFQLDEYKLGLHI